jgi:photosystem II stability/assembly factor-like uncharacterized protein
MTESGRIAQNQSRQEEIMNSRREKLATSLCILMAVAFLNLSDRPASGQIQGTWTRCGGPIGGLGYDVRMHPLHPDTMFVTDSFAGVFRSFDGGQNWHPINNGIDLYGGESGDAIKVFSLTIDPVDHNTIWLGLQDFRGIYKSTDLGENWTMKADGIVDSAGLSIRGFTVDPLHPDTVYAAGELNSIAWAGSLVTGNEFDMVMGVVYKTVNGGDHWDEIWRGDNLARYIWIDPRDTDVLYVSTGIMDREAANADTATLDPGGVGILKSYDGGASWDTVNTGLTNMYVGTLFMHPVNPDILLAGTDAGGVPAGVFLTTNGGELWTKVLTDGINSVEFSLSNPLIAYAGGNTRVYLSRDGGWSWEPRTSVTGVWGGGGVEAGFPIDFQVDPRDPGRLFTNNYGGGNFVSADSGHTWQIASKGYTGAHVRDVAVAFDNPARVYAAVRTGMFYSDNSGEDWYGLVHPPATGTEWNAAALNPLNSYHLLAGNMYSREIYESRDGGETWRSDFLILPEKMAWRCFAFAPSDTQVIYAGSGGTLSAGRFNNPSPAMGIWKSTNGGLNWAPANDTTSQYANIAELAVHSTNPLHVYAATTNLGVLQTLNGGINWGIFNTGLPSEPKVLSVAIDPNDSNHVFVGLDDAGFHETINGGILWSPVPAGLPAESDVTDIAYCPTDGNLIYISDQRSGVYRSVDNGDTWIKVNNGLRMRAVNALAFSGDGQTLYAGTEGEGVYRLDGAGPVTAVKDQPSIALTIELRQNYPNPFNPRTTIEYTTIKGKDVHLAIYDVAGRLVKLLVEERAQSTGSHKAVWDGRLSNGHPAATGVYFCRLVVEDHKVSKKLVLVK